MRDPTWRCAVMTSATPELLPSGIYHGIDDELPAEPIGELERWASVTDADRPARHVEGPWGAFAVADVAVSDRLAAILYAPWEGRMDPSPAEIALLTLVGQHAGTALEHSLLYAQVRHQADELNRLAGVQADFLRGVTHDLQTPLTSIAALATELRAGEELSDAARADLDSIAHQAERLRRMVSQLLVASRLDAGVLTPQQEVFAVRPLIERTWAALRADRPFELDVDGPAAPGRRRSRIAWSRCCGRVLDNAVKYSPPQSPVHAAIDGRDGLLAITIRDRGTGHGCRHARARIRAVLPSRCRSTACARWERRRPVCRERPHAGDGRTHRDQRRNRRGHPGDAAGACRAQRRGRRVGPRYPGGPGRRRGTPARWLARYCPYSPGQCSVCRLSKRSSRGQAMAEFALLLPILALLLVMAVDFGRVFFGWVGVQNAARIAANYAAQHPLDDYADTGSSDFQDYQDEVDADTTGINCDLPTPLPAPTFPGGTAPGSDAVVAFTCDFTPITPLASIFVGSPLTIAAESTFPIRTGTVGSPGGGGGPPGDPLCRTVPDMEAMTVANARTAWSFAGFSGTFSPAAGDDDQIVVSQVTNPASVPGECITFAATVVADA